MGPGRSDMILLTGGDMLNLNSRSPGGFSQVSFDRPKDTCLPGEGKNKNKKIPVIRNRMEEDLRCEHLL